MVRALVLLLAASSTAVLAEEAAPASPPPLVPDVSPERSAPASSRDAAPKLRPLSRGDSNRFRRPKGPIPAGFHLVEAPRWGFVAGGAVAFGVGTGVMVALAALTGKPLLAIPFAGPFIGVADAMRGSSSLDAMAIFLYGGLAAIADLTAQVAGIVMFVVGFTSPSRWIERDAPAAPRVMLVPGAAGAPVGASLVGRF